jgi:hypothetical protein
MEKFPYIEYYLGAATRSARGTGDGLLGKFWKLTLNKIYKGVMI